LRLRFRKFLLLRNAVTQSAELLVQLRDILSPFRSPPFDCLEKKIRRCKAHTIVQALVGKLLQDDVKQVEVAVTQMDRGPFVAVKVEQRGWVCRAFSLKIK